jgi:hypothetical protein
MQGMKKLLVFGAFFALGLLFSVFLLQREPPTSGSVSLNENQAPIAPKSKGPRTSLDSSGPKNPGVEKRGGRSQKFGDIEEAVAQVHEMRKKNYGPKDLEQLRRSMNGSPHWLVRWEALRQIRPLLGQVPLKTRDRILKEAGPSLVQAAAMSEREILEATFNVR